MFDRPESSTDAGSPRSSDSLLVEHPPGARQSVSLDGGRVDAADPDFVDREQVQQDEDDFC